MKKTLKIIAIVLLALILGIGGCIGWFKYQESSYATTAIPYIKETLPLLSTWEVSVAKTHMTQEGLQGTSEEELKKLMDWFKKLGKLDSFEEPKLVHVSVGANAGPSKKLLIYTIEAQFEAGAATITLRLSDLGSGKFKIHGLNINSAALIG